MAPVIWGLDLAEIKWRKFKSSYMWSNEYHLRRTKFIVYQCALIFCVVSESLGTAALSDYVGSQGYVTALDADVYVVHNGYMGAACYNIFAGVFVAFIFGAAFFFDLFWPERYESKAVLLAWKIGGMLAVVVHLAAALTLTVVTAMHCGHEYLRGGADAEHGPSLHSPRLKDGGTPLCYRHNRLAVAAAVFGWVGWVSVVGSCILLFLSTLHHHHTSTEPARQGRRWAQTRERDVAAAAAVAEAEAEKGGLGSETDGGGASASVGAGAGAGAGAQTAELDTCSPGGKSNSTTASTFSQLAKRLPLPSSYIHQSPRTTFRKPFGGRSVASLTSGLGDAGAESR